MEAKTYEQMEADFKEFYFKKIKPRLEEYEKERKKGAPKIIAFKLTWFSFLTGFILLILSAQSFFGVLLEHITTKIVLVGIISAGLTLIGFISIAVAICSMIWLIYLTRNDPNDSSGAKVIKTDFEYNLKLVLMRYFLEIFSQNADWHKGIRHGYWEKIDTYRKTNIFNPFPYALFDDTISLVFKNIEINIYEVNTSIFNNVTTMLLPFLFIWLGAFFGITFIVICPLAVALFIVKIYKYAPFKGIVVELKFNKDFQGHTFFLNKSFNSKKITINRKKYENVKLESVDFMNKYNVFSTDQVEARYILTTAMIDRLEHLKLAFQANYIRGSFKDNKLILAIDTGKDMFAMGNDFKESNLQTFRNLFNEIISILKIIDQLKLDEKTGI